MARPEKRPREPSGFYDLPELSGGIGAQDCLDLTERDLVGASLLFLSAVDPPAAERLREDLSRLYAVALVARSLPSLLQSEDLVERLCQADAELGALNMPVRAVMGEAFLVAKIQALRSLHQTLQGHRPDPSLLCGAEREVAQSIHTRILAELLWGLLRCTDVPLPTRQRATTELVRLWESSDSLEVDDFFPVLEAVWRARNRVRVTFGTLLGSVEFFHLMREECPPAFVSFFTREEVSADENGAFQEFLLGLVSEDVERLRDAMRRDGRTVADQAFVLQTLGHRALGQEGEPEAMYRSYRIRDRAAEQRRRSGAPGPRQTAEAYLVLHLLQHPSLVDP